MKCERHLCAYSARAVATFVIAQQGSFRISGVRPKTTQARARLCLPCLYSLVLERPVRLRIVPMPEPEASS